MTESYHAREEFYLIGYWNMYRYNRFSCSNTNINSEYEAKKKLCLTVGFGRGHNLYGLCIINSEAYLSRIALATDLEIELLSSCNDVADKRSDSE